jgi:toxin YoeB
MRVIFSAISFGQYVAWQEEDRKIARKINTLIKDCQRNPFTGLGKPEPLKNDWAGWWSRRIDKEHRLVYRVTGTGESQTLEIAQCRYHY